jgi:hypothetical protein
MGVAPDQTAATFEFRGEPGDFVFHAYALTTEDPVAYAPSITASVYVGSDVQLLFQGNLDANGELTRTYFVDGTGFPVLHVVQQVLYFGREGVFVSSNPVVTLMLDD